MKSAVVDDVRLLVADALLDPSVLTLIERVDDLRAWASSRIEQCRRDELKFFAGAGGKRVGLGTVAVGDAGIRAVQERQTLQAVLRMLGPGD